jgi:Na+-transporting methylmalonyl-CoA/oxaloacetate decarboxylase gamma subunit
MAGVAFILVMIAVLGLLVWFMTRPCTRYTDAATAATASNAFGP